MTQLRRDAAYIRTKTNSPSHTALKLSPFDEKVCQVLSSAHTVVSAAKAIAHSDKDAQQDLETRVAESMRRLLEADRIELSPDS